MSRRPNIKIMGFFQILKLAALLCNGSSFALWRARLSTISLSVFSSTSSSSPLILWPVTVLRRWCRRANCNPKTWRLPYHCAHSIRIPFCLTNTDWLPSLNPFFVPLMIGKDWHGARWELRQHWLASTGADVLRASTLAATEEGAALRAARLSSSRASLDWRRELRKSGV